VSIEAERDHEQPRSRIAELEQLIFAQSPLDLTSLLRRHYMPVIARTKIPALAQAYMRILRSPLMLQTSWFGRKIFYIHDLSVPVGCSRYTSDH
jgi:hypothetical protein